MTILNERIKKLRKSLELTQQEFAEKIGTNRNNIAGYETGKRSPSEAVISLICREFNVSETWLRTGEGGDEAMFLTKTRDEEIAAFMNELLAAESADFRLRLVTALSHLTPQQWDALKAVALNLLAEPPSHPKAAKEDTALSIDEQVELYRQHLLSERGLDTSASSASGSGGG